jgi:FlaA1/EpsC-like NDP-sugar epimerase
VRFNFKFSEIDWDAIWINVLLVLFVSTLFFLFFKSYVSIIRHTSLSDAVKVFQALTVTVAVIILFVLVNTHFIGVPYFKLPISILLIFYVNAVFSLVFLRILIKLMYNNLIRRESHSVNTLIIGAGELGIVTKNTLQISGPSNNRLLGFIDENAGKIGKTIEGVPIFHPNVITQEFIDKKEIREVIFAIQNIDGERKKAFIDKLVKMNLMVKIVPPVESWIQGKLNIKQIQRVKIEDLLQRDPIRLDNPKVIEFIQDKVVMVTGAAGSIGSELVRQLLMLKPQKLILVDQAETPLFELKFANSSIHRPNPIHTEYIIADISDHDRMDSVFKQWKPYVIFHAAAYKHVPMMEDNPFEAVRVNIFGTKNIADLAVKYHTEFFVMISTDKAVRPTNVMGATKRFAEMYCQSLGNKPDIKTMFITTRFGNVLGSNGSVVKIFRSQIEKGGPITVTHPDITRYFMTIPEACNLVLEAGTMSEGSEIFIFDMGEPVRIADMARKMIHLAGFDPDTEIKIEYSGLRPGEKLYEELLNTGENTVPTYHSKIMIAHVDVANYGNIILSLEKFKEASRVGDAFRLVGVLKEAIPDFVSNNSVYQSLDKVAVPI